MAGLLNSTQGTSVLASPAAAVSAAATPAPAAVDAASTWAPKVALDTTAYDALKAANPATFQGSDHIVGVMQNGMGNYYNSIARMDSADANAYGGYEADTRAYQKRFDNYVENLAKGMTGNNAWAAAAGAGGGGGGGSSGAAVETPAIEKINPYIQDVSQYGQVKNQLSGLLNADSDYMQAARLRAMQEGSARGLLNTSLAATSGEKAAIEAALPIANVDAASTNTQALANQAASNTADQFNANWSNDFTKLAQTQANSLQSATLSAKLQSELNAQAQAATAAENSKAQGAQAALNTQNISATAAQNTQQQAAAAALNAQQQAATAAREAQQQAATAAINAQQQAATKKAADSAQAQTLYTAMNTLKTDASKYVTSIMADTTLDDAAKAATIKSYLATATATQEGYNAQLAVLNFAPGAYFDFNTLSGH